MVGSPQPLYLIEILHQTTTRENRLTHRDTLYLIEILHQTTTQGRYASKKVPLYLIEILHQTTTLSATTQLLLPLYLIEILHQTTTRARLALSLPGCILSKFYIKPQLDESAARDYLVVSYRNSTSNHNISRPIIFLIRLYLIEILHQTTTLGHPSILARSLYLIEILHQTTTRAYPP